MKTEKEERIAAFIKANPGLTAAQMAEKCDISRAHIYQVAKKHHLSYARSKTGRPLKGMENLKYDRSICADRPHCCFNCPYADCICYEAATDIEASFVFLGLQSENTKDQTHKKLEVFN